MTKLKCWKKLPGEGEYFKKGDKYSYVKFFKTGLSSKEIKRRGIKPHIFSARIGRNGEETKKYFKKEIQAKEEAIKYMKSHDKC